MATVRTWLELTRQRPIAIIASPTVDVRAKRWAAVNSPLKACPLFLLDASVVGVVVGKAELEAGDSLALHSDARLLKHYHKWRALEEIALHLGVNLHPLVLI